MPPSVGNVIEKNRIKDAEHLLCIVQSLALYIDKYLQLNIDMIRFETIEINDMLNWNQHIWALFLFSIFFFNNFIIIYQWK